MSLRLDDGGYRCAQAGNKPTYIQTFACKECARFGEALCKIYSDIIMLTYCLVRLYCVWSEDLGEWK